MRLLASVLLIAFAQAGSQSYPPPYPRAGTTSLVDNDRVLVWDVTWPKGAAAGLHRHPYDMTGIYYWPGERIITSQDGTKRTTATEAGRIQWLRAGVIHAEEGASDDSLRAVMIELKGDHASGKVDKSPDVPAFTVSTMPLLDNERVTVWDYAGPQAKSPRHRHPMDTVVVFTSQKSARTIFIPAGTVHAAEEVPAGTKATVFELK
jgi:quercetin dioxygenase-like cupin family protein